MKDIRQTPQYANYLKELGWIVERIDGVNYFIKKLPIIGSVLKIQRPEHIRYKDIKILGERNRTFQIIVEPKNKYQGSSIKYQGFRLSKSPYLPTKTLQLDLTQSEKKIFGQFKKDARYALKKLQNSLPDRQAGKHSKLQTNQNIKVFRNCWKKAVGWKRYVPPLKNLQALKKAFWGNALFLTTKNCSSGAIFLLAEGAACYWQAFTSKEGRKKLYQYKIVWEGILWAKKMGARIFDFEGIYDERFPNKSWLGFTHFKKSFGGYEVNYPGCYTKFRFSL